MTPVVFEPTISAGERPQPYALHRATAGTPLLRSLQNNIKIGKQLQYLIIFLPFLHTVSCRSHFKTFNNFHFI